MDHECIHTESLKRKSSKMGGMKHLERLLGIRQDIVLSTDAVFVSLDLEVASDRQRLHLSAEKPVVTQLAFASLDTRDIRSLSASSDLRHLISLRMFEVIHPARTKKAAKAEKNEKQCLFARTRFIASDKVSSTITQNLRIRDSRAGPKNRHLQNIILVGHSLGEDLRILRLLDIDPASVGPISTIIDTHSMARFVFPPYHPNRAPEPGQDFSLAGVLAELGCLPHRSGFHNAGNDAVYTLYAMLLLAIKEGMAREAKLSASELRSLETIGAAVFDSVEQSIYPGFIRPPLKTTRIQQQ